ncbi:MAG: DUF3750 domain-containing protein [Rhizobiales bacterium]|nr:DUF3750 domain-containing protein [Hyphomicrobiales bacterium]
MAIFFGALLAVIFVPILVGTVIGYARGWPESWRAASWESSGVLPDAKSLPEASVRILAARTGRWKGIFAVHTWIVMKDRGDAPWVRHDVVGWGKPVRRDNYAADAYWYGNTPYIVNEIRGEAAERMIPEIERVIVAYPWQEQGSYTVWPGPNSNSFIAWLTRHVPGLQTEMPATAIGKDYLGPGLKWAKTPSGTGWQISAWGLAGASLALEEGLELNILGTTLGIDPKGLSVKVPALGVVGAGRALGDPT